MFAQAVPQTNSVEITMEQAKEIALKKAGFSESEVKWLEVKYEYDHGRGEYEIEFEKNKIEYEYEIDSKTGKITGIKIEEEDGWFK